MKTLVAGCFAGVALGLIGLSLSYWPIIYTAHVNSNLVILSTIILFAGMEWYAALIKKQFLFAWGGLLGFVLAIVILFVSLWGA